MWTIREHRGIAKACRKLPDATRKKYELWKGLVFRHGPEKLKEFPGFHDEKLKGRRAGLRSSRLDQQHRVVCAVDRRLITVFVVEITPHKY